MPIVIKKKKGDSNADLTNRFKRISVDEDIVNEIKDRKRHKKDSRKRYERDKEKKRLNRKRPV